MKSIQKLILPALIIIIAVVIYFVYFSPAKGLGAFSDFDPNNNASKDILVEIVKDKGFNRQPDATLFYAVDKNGVEVMVQGPAELPAAAATSEIVMLKGHIHKDFFHAHEVIPQ